MPNCFDLNHLVSFSELLLMVGLAFVALWFSPGKLQEPQEGLPSALQRSAEQLYSEEE